jgi:cyanophycinase
MSDDTKSPLDEERASGWSGTDRRQRQPEAVAPTPETAPSVGEAEHTPPTVHREEVVGSAPVATTIAPEAAAASATVAATSPASIPVAVPATPPVPPAAPPVPALSSRGWLVPIGGRMEDPAIIDRFVELCGGAAARIVVIPTASNQPDTGSWYQQVFARHGAPCVELLRLQRRGDAVAAEQLDAVARATGVFFTGGNQLKLATIIIGTPLAELLRTRFAVGLHVAGTSAGAAFLSAHMIAFGKEGPVPEAGMVITCGGLGLTERYIIDQHFQQRHRMGRLLTAVAYNPFLIGLGVDENTAVFIGPDGALDVVGEGAVTMVDPAELDTTDILEALPGTAITLPGMQVRVLRAGEVLAAT